MQSGAELLDRTLAAIEGGLRLPDDVRQWLGEAFAEYRANPDAELDKLLGLRPGRGKCSIASTYREQHCARLYRDCYETHYQSVAPTTAAKDMVTHFEVLASNEGDPHVPEHIRRLYGEVVSLKGRAPKHWRRIYDTALQKNAGFPCTRSLVGRC